MSVHYNTKIVTDGLVYAMDAKNVKCYSGSGTTVNDLSQLKTNATLVNGASFATDSFSFDGVDDYINPGAISAGWPGITVEVWFKHSVVGDYHNTLDCNYSTSSGGNQGPRFEVNSTGRQTWLFGGTPANNGVYNQLVVKPDAVAGVWYHTAFTWASTSSVNGYWNGEPSIVSNTSSGGNSNAWYQDVGDLMIGRGFSAGTVNQRSFTGNIAIVKIYNRALSASEIKTNFYAHRTRFGI